MRHIASKRVGYWLATRFLLPQQPNESPQGEDPQGASTKGLLEWSDGMLCGSANGMKIAILVDDGLLKQADQAARDLGLSRNEFVAETLRFFLRQHRQAQITRQLNRAYETGPTPGERAITRKLKTKLTAPDAW